MATTVSPFVQHTLLTGERDWKSDDMTMDAYSINMEFKIQGRMSAKSSLLKSISVEQQEDKSSDVSDKGKSKIKSSGTVHEEQGSMIGTDNLPSNRLRMELWINKYGGVLELPDTGVSLEIPPGALEKDQLIQMRIIPYNFQGDSDLSFSSNSSVVVELLPSNLKLLKPVKLTLPHCLVLKKGCEWKAKIYTSHHEEGTQPLWRPQPDTPYVLTERNCVIYLTHFSWEKFDIGDEIVEGKRIVLYAAKDLSSSGSITHIHVGYYLDLPGGEKIVSINAVSVLVKQRAVFYKKGKLPLKILLVKIVPPAWICGSEEKNPKEIPFIRVATSRNLFCTYVLHVKEGTQMRPKCTCYFMAGQESDLMYLLFNLQDEMEDSAASRFDKLVDAGLSQSQKRTGDEIQTVKQPLRNIDLEVRTESLWDLSGKIPREWKKVGRILGLKEMELEYLERDTYRGHKEIVYQMLLTWKQSRGVNATYRVLGEALEAAGGRDLQEMLYKQDKTVEQQEDKSSDVSSKGKAPDPSSVKQPSTSALDRVVTTATIQDLSHIFCDEWRIVGSKLGIGELKLQTIDTDNRTAQEKVYQMLLTWKQSKGYEATYILLGEALQSAGRKDLQEYLYQQDLRDQQIKIEHRNEDRERSSSKRVKRESTSPQMERAKHKHHEVKRESTSPQMERAKHKHHEVKRKSTSPQMERTKQNQLDNIKKEHQSEEEEDKAQMQFRSTPHQITDFSQPGPSKSSAHSGKKMKQQIVLTPQITKAPQISTQGKTAYQILSKPLRAMLMINKEGGRLDIPDTGVSLEIPSGALDGEQFIQMIIIPPHRLENESLSFASNTSLVVELLPSNLNLLKPAILTLPHCLVLKKGCEWKAKIYRSHHKEGSKPQWEEQFSTPYKLGEENCVIEIQRFSWDKFEVNTQIVEAKNIIMFATGRCGPMDTIYLDIGYYLNLATFKEVPTRNNASLLHEQPTVFYNNRKPLDISLKKFTPKNWTCNRRKTKKQAISFNEVAIAPWIFRTFVLDKTEPKGTDACTCYCKAGQAPNLQDFIFQLKAPDPSSVQQPSTSNRQEDERVGTSTAGIEAPDLVVTTETIEDLYEKFCREWKTVGRKLNIGEPKLQAIDTENRTEQEKVFQMLLTWKQSKGNKATYRLLGEAFEAAGLEDLQQYLYQQGHHSEQRHGDNLQEGRRSIEEPIHQDERPSEVERTPRELHVGSDGPSTSSDLRDQQIKLKHKNEDKERSSSKYHLQQKHPEDREKKRVSRKRKGATHKHHEVKRKSNSPQRKRAKHKHHEVKRKSTSPQMEREKHKHHKVKRKSISRKRTKHKHHEGNRKSTSPQMKRTKQRHRKVKRKSTSPQMKKTKQYNLDDREKEHQSEEDKAQAS